MGNLLLDTTFTNWARLGQAYPGAFPSEDFPAMTGAEEVQTLGYTFYGGPMDAVYHLEFTFTHTGTTLDLAFISQQLQALLDESWGVDNVVVTISATSPSPSHHIFLPMIAR